MTPLAPYDWQAWVVMIVACLYMEIARRIVRRKLLKGKFSWNPLKELGLASYNSIVSVTSGAVVFDTEDTSVSEKIIIAGFR